MKELIEIAKEAFLENIDLDNKILNDGKAVCTHCEKVTKIKSSSIDLKITNKYNLKNIECFICEECLKVSVIDKDAQLLIEEKIKDIKKTRPSIDLLLDQSDDSHSRWCGSYIYGCGCMGAANCSGGLLDHLYTKNDWIIWKNDNLEEIDKYKNKDYYKNHKIFIHNKNRLSTLKAFKNIFRLDFKVLSDLVDKSDFEVVISFNSDEKSDILYTIQSLFDKLKEYNITFDKKEYSPKEDEHVKKIVIN